MSDVASGDRDLLRAGEREVERLSEDWERRLRFLDEGDFERLRDFFRLESAGEDVWLLLFFFFSFTSFGSIAWRMKINRTYENCRDPFGIEWVSVEPIGSIF